MLQADLICIRELLGRDKQWDFYMNPAASELPLMAVGEIEDLVREGHSKYLIKRSDMDYYSTFT